MTWIVFGVVVLISLALICAQPFGYVLQYVFFCRFVALLALLLLALPLLAIGPARLLLGNLFSLDPLGVGIVAAVGALASWFIMSITEVLFAVIDDRFKLPFVRRSPAHVPFGWGPALRRTVEPGLRWFQQLVAQDAPRRTILFGLLAAPIVSFAIGHSWGSDSWQWLIPGAGVGVAVAYLVHWFARRLVVRVSDRAVRYLEPRRQRRADAPGALAGYVDRPDLLGHHARAASYLVLTFLVYFVGHWALEPAILPGLSSRFPALALLLLLSVFLSAVLTGVAYFFDLFRVPVTLIIVCASYTAYQLANIDHIYRTRPNIPTPADSVPLTPARAMAAWDARHPADRYPVMVVVAASGGGIAAARWTARVLTGLSAAVGDEFGGSVTLISSASGGGVGAMYFVDHYSPNRPPSQEALDTILRVSSEPSLEAAVWGLAYPDLWRSIPIVASFASSDGGVETEAVWAEHMPSDPTLRGWRRDVSQGWRPAQVFNATMAETGTRFVLTPLDNLSPDVAGRSSGFLQLYPGLDVEVVTAARLSATFPFVSPVARPNVPPAVAYHLADGGYYDNSGLMSAIEYLRAVLPAFHTAVPGRAPRRVLVLQIRLESADTIPAGTNRGWTYAEVGPVLTILNVRTAAQQARNNLELSLLLDRWQGSVTIDTVSFVYSGHAPLSWQLSRDERDAIDAAWEGPDIRRRVERVQRLFQP